MTSPQEPQPDPLADLTARFGSAPRTARPPLKSRPDGLTDAAVEALGKLSAALETAEDARGHLYSFHRLSGRADLDLQDAVQALREAGHGAVADTVATVMVGRNVIGDHWSFELVEDYDANYLTPFRATEQAARAAVDAPVHLAEAEMKAREQREA
ncbi:MAG TPA: hypothetical protein VIG48_02025 [Jatrophihabitans sp.]|jgi:hypothetical protein